MYILFYIVFVSFSSQDVHLRSKLWVVGMMRWEGQLQEVRVVKMKRLAVVLRLDSHAGSPGWCWASSLNLATAVWEGHGFTQKAHRPEGEWLSCGKKQPGCFCYQEGPGSLSFILHCSLTVYRVKYGVMITLASWLPPVRVCSALVSPEPPAQWKSMYYLVLQFPVVKPMKTMVSGEKKIESPSKPWQR